MATERPSAPPITMMAFIPAILGLTLAATPFLPDSVAADLIVRSTLVAYATIAAVDFMTRKVPNLLVYSSIAFVLIATGIVDASLLPEALVGGSIALAVMFGLALLSRGSMGMGDVKAACLGGCLVGWPGGLVALLFGFAIAAAVSLPLLLLRLRGRKDSVPLTPFLLSGTIVYGIIVNFLLTPGL